LNITQSAQPFNNAKRTNEWKENYQNTVSIKEAKRAKAGCFEKITAKKV
jgi:hypothetical protein